MRAVITSSPAFQFTGVVTSCPSVSYVRQALQNGGATAAGLFLVRLNGVSPPRPDTHEAPRSSVIFPELIAM
jgi:hypothetical protein